MPPSPVPEVPLPRLELARVFATRLALYDALRAACAADAVVAAGAPFQAAVAAVWGVLRTRGVARTVVLESLGDLVDRAATRDRLWAVAWRLAGNLATLRCGWPAVAWSGQAAPEWAPVQISGAILAARRFHTGAARIGCTFRFAVLAGSPCPMTIVRWWSRDQYMFIAREIGFTPPWGRMRLEHAYQLVGLRLLALIEPEWCRDSKPGFRTVACPTGLLAYNKRILKRRFRVEPCPWNYQHECHMCSVGYTGRDGVDACLAATHARTYDVRACPDCHAAEAAFDAELTAARCVTCETRRRLAAE